MRCSRIRGIGNVCSCPAIRTGIVSPARVKVDETAGLPTPDDHFASGPHGRMEFPPLRWARSGCPSIFDAAAPLDLWKCILAAELFHLPDGRVSLQLSLCALP